MDAFVDPITKLKIKNPLVSSILLERTIKGRNVKTLARVTAAAPNSETTEVDTCGVLVSKSCERKTSRGDPFCVWRLSDLACASQCTITLMLFGDAQQTHADVRLGNVLLLLGASPMEEREPSSSGSNGRNSGSTSGDGPKMSVRCAEPWQVVRLGEALDFGICKGTRKDGLSCSIPVNKSLCGGYCRYHLPRGHSAVPPPAPGLSNKTKLGALMQARTTSRANDSSSGSKSTSLGGKGTGKGGKGSVPGLMGQIGGAARGGAAGGGSQGDLLANLMAQAQQGNSGAFSTMGCGSSSSSSFTSGYSGSSSGLRTGNTAVASSRFGGAPAALSGRATTATTSTTSGAMRNARAGAYSSSSSSSCSGGGGGQGTAVSLRQQQLENMEVPAGSNSIHRQPHRQPQAQAQQSQMQKKRPFGSNGDPNANAAGAESRGSESAAAKRARTLTAAAASASVATKGPSTKKTNAKDSAVANDDMDPLGALLSTDQEDTRAKAPKTLRAFSSTTTSSSAISSRDRVANKQPISSQRPAFSSTSSASLSSTPNADGSCLAAALEASEPPRVVNDGSYRNGRVAVPSASSVFEVAAAKRVEKLNERLATRVGPAPPHSAFGSSSMPHSSNTSSTSSSSSSSHFNAAAMRAHQQQEAAAAVQLQARRALEQSNDPFKKHRDECPVAALAAVSGQYPTLGLTPQFLERERLAMASSHAQAAALMRREQATTASGSTSGGEVRGVAGRIGSRNDKEATVDGGTLRKLLADRKQQQAMQAAQANGAGASLALALRNTKTSTSTLGQPRMQGQAAAAAARASTGRPGHGPAVSGSVGGNGGRANASSNGSNGSSSSSNALSGLNLPPALESLINVKSKYASGAQQEAAENCAASLEWLEAKDNAAAERDKITEEKCRAYTCHTCSSTTAHVVGACTLAGHSVTAVAAVRRFWACGGCTTRKSTVSPLQGGQGSAMRPPKACRKCAEKGTANAVWKRCGAGKATGGALGSGSGNTGLVLSVAESTSYRDVWGSGLDAISDKH